MENFDILECSSQGHKPVCRWELAVLYVKSGCLQSSCCLGSPPSFSSKPLRSPVSPTQATNLGQGFGVCSVFFHIFCAGGGGGVGLRKVLILYPWLFWNPLWPGWPQTQIHRKSPASASWVPGLRVCVTRPSCFGFIWGFNISDCSYYLLLLYYSLKDHILVFVFLVLHQKCMWISILRLLSFFFFLFPSFVIRKYYITLKSKESWVSVLYNIKWIHLPIVREIFNAPPRKFCAVKS